jgi:hypothetical protein
MNLKSQVQSQYDYARTHKGKAIGSALGIIAGVSYGLAGKKDNWMIVGLTMAGAVGGAILGGMFDKQPTLVLPVDNGDKTAVNDTAGQDGVSSATGDGLSYDCWCQDPTIPKTMTTGPVACQAYCSSKGSMAKAGNVAKASVRRR